MSDGGLSFRIYKVLKKQRSQKSYDSIINGLADLNNKFSKEEIKMIKKYLKKCSNFLIFREMQIKTALIFHLTPFIMDKIKKTNDSKCWWDLGKEKLSLLVRFQKSTAIVKISVGNP